VSKLKTPREKKLASLALDRRNVYGENDKASRKSIPLRKQMSHQAERRAAKQPLLTATPALGEDHLADVELQILNSDTRAKRRAFKKEPDEPLGEVLKHRRTGDWTRKFPG
jgi:hypothetical protein